MKTFDINLFVDDTLNIKLISINHMYYILQKQFDLLLFKDSCHKKLFIHTLLCNLPKVWSVKNNSGAIWDLKE